MKAPINETCTGSCEAPVFDGKDNASTAVLDKQKIATENGGTGFGFESLGLRASGPVRSGLSDKKPASAQKGCGGQPSYGLACQPKLRSSEGWWSRAGSNR